MCHFKFFRCNVFLVWSGKGARADDVHLSLVYNTAKAGGPRYSKLFIRPPPSFSAPIKCTLQFPQQKEFRKEA